MIHFTLNGIYADTLEEKLAFYDRMHAGDPIIMAHIEIWRHWLIREEKEVRDGPKENIQV